MNVSYFYYFVHHLYMYNKFEAKINNIKTIKEDMAAVKTYSYAVVPNLFWAMPHLCISNPRVHVLRMPNQWGMRTTLRMTDLQEKKCVIYAKDKWLFKI